MNFTLRLISIAIFIFVSSSAFAENYSLQANIQSVAQDHSGIIHIELENAVCPGNNRNYFYWKIDQGTFNPITRETSAAWMSLALTAMVSRNKILVISDYQPTSPCQIYHIKIVNE